MLKKVRTEEVLAIFAFMSDSDCSFILTEFRTEQSTMLLAHTQRGPVSRWRMILQFQASIMGSEADYPMYFIM